MKSAAIVIAVLALAGCATVHAVNADGANEVRLGQRADLAGPKVTVLKVLEDSRCPMEARCVWAGRVRVQVRVELGSGARLHELVSDQPLPIADGALELVGVMPPRSTQRKIKPGDYRFTLRFNGGL